MTIASHLCLSTGQQQSHQDLTENDNMPRSVFPRNNMHYYVQPSLCVRAEEQPFSVSNGARAERWTGNFCVFAYVSHYTSYLLDLLLPHSHQPTHP
jgi:hypothetical protein